MQLIRIGVIAGLILLSIFATMGVSQTGQTEETTSSTWIRELISTGNGNILRTFAFHSK